MIFMILFWCSIIVLAILFYLDKIKKREIFSDLMNFLVVFQLILFFLAIATDDPLLPSSWDIDPWWELTIEGCLAAFAVWKAYLNPLKKKVYEMDREVGEIKATMAAQYQSLNMRIDALNSRIDALDKKFDNLLDLLIKSPH